MSFVVVNRYKYAILTAINRLILVHLVTATKELATVHDFLKLIFKKYQFLKLFSFQRTHLRFSIYRYSSFSTYNKFGDPEYILISVLISIFCQNS